MSTQKFETKALHAGYDVTNNKGTRAVPIYQSSSYVFNSEHAANLFKLAESEFIEDLKADLKGVFESIKVLQEA